MVIPLSFITTFILGLLVSVTFGLLLFPLSVIWIVCFLGPLFGLSWVWEKCPLLRVPTALIGIPLAFGGNIFACLMPSMGELDSRVSKLLLSELWPYTLDFWRLARDKSVPNSPGAQNLRKILTDLSKSPPTLQYLEYIGVADLVLEGNNEQEAKQ